MRVQLLLAHPLADSYAAALAARARAALERAGHELRSVDLYRDGFDPRLTAAERASYFGTYDSSAVSSYAGNLRWAEGHVLVFPQWWFNVPAILKGYFDRVWVPGVACDHDLARGRLVPRLTHVRKILAITTFGAPWWVVEFYLRNPVRAQLKKGLVAGCAPQAQFRMLAHYDMDRSTPETRERFLARVDRALERF